MKIPTAERAETAATGETAATAERVETTVEVKLTGHVRSAAGTHRTEFTFEGETLRAFLEAFFAAYDVRDLVIAEREADATTRGWARVDRPPGTWRKNPEGEQTQPYARVLVNGVFNENLDGFDTRLEDGDRVALMKPFLYCV
ncbi:MULTISPECIES: MoaD/ThiS family protein [Haloferax]|uniref:MoaD family protein n=3 Tax=Haloferax TaxID=2251 RepID=D4GSL9_HALVD|nr:MULTISPECIES: MoaD/ThiS family protein [Haloferax]ADE04066.1 MoaD family protein [Haloferax volcanii DS2]MBC9985423.1 pterin cluster protein [Haloferax sp. AS1]MBS8119823.1 MoaD/ThiS family protein [Haloferax volcanii]MBS8124835.1 MoaD/ThiS family protein [Haloferax volcanii]MBS8128898.1 MoaD/ThiS family protein [Haloferax volcanii]